MNSRKWPDLTGDAVELLNAVHQGDVITYARITQQLRRTQYGTAMTRELVDLLLDILGAWLENDDAAVETWLDNLAQEWQKLKNKGHV